MLYRKLRMDLKPNIPIILLLTAITITSGSIGTSYLGSYLGFIVCVLSISFLIAFFAVNLRNRQLIEEKMSKNEKLIICVVYLAATPLILLINSLNPPSIFLISLSAFYIFLTMIWTIFTCNKSKNTKFSIILLFFLCLIPLFYGIYLNSNYEKDIDQEIIYLEKQNEYYHNHLDDIAYGINEGHLPPQLDESPIADRIRELGYGLKEVRACYQRADYNKCHEKLEELKSLNAKVDNFFKWLNPGKKMCEEYYKADSVLANRSEQYYNLMMILLNEDNTNEELIAELKGIEENISIAREKLDEAWLSYENEEYNSTFKNVCEVKAESFGYLYNIDRDIGIMKIKMGCAI